MAEEVQGVLAVELRAKLEGLKQDLGKVKPLLQDTEKAILTTGQKWTQAGASIMKVGAVITGAITAPLIAMATSALKAFASFEQAMAGVKAVSGATGQEFKKLTDLAKELGATTKFTAVEAAEGMVMLGRAGMTANEILAAMPGLLKLAAAGAVDLGTAADIISDVMMAFGADMSEAGRYADVFAQAAARANTTVEALGQAMAYAAPAAAAAGLSVEQTAAALSALADAGIKGSRAGTTMDAVMRELRNRVVDGKLEFGAFTVAVYDSEGAMRDLFSILGDIEEGMKGMTQEQRDAALGMNFTTRALRGMNVWLVRGVDDLRDLENGLLGAHGAAGRMSDIMMGTLQGATIEFTSAIEGLKISFGEFMAPTAQSFVRTLTDIARWLTNTDEATKKVAIVIGVIAASIGPLVTLLGMLAVGIGLVASHLPLILSTVLPVMAALTALGAVVYVLAKEWVADSMRIEAAHRRMASTIEEESKKVSAAFAAQHAALLHDQAGRHVDAVQAEIDHLIEMGHTVENSTQLRDAYAKLREAIAAEQDAWRKAQILAERAFLIELETAPDPEGAASAWNAFFDSQRALIEQRTQDSIAAYIDNIDISTMTDDEFKAALDVIEDWGKASESSLMGIFKRHTAVMQSSFLEQGYLVDSSTGELMEATTDNMAWWSGSIAGALRDNMALVPPEMRGYANSILDSFNAAMINENPEEAMTFLYQMLDLLGTMKVDFKDGAEIIIDDMIASFLEGGPKLVEAWGDGIQDVDKVTEEKWQKAVDAVETILSGDFPPMVKTQAEEVMKNLGEGFGDAEPDALEAVNQLMKAVELELMAFDVTTPAEMVGAKITGGVGTGMTKAEALQQLEREVHLMTQSVIAATHKNLDIKSPSQVMVSIGKSITEGLAQGISGNVDAVINAILDVVKQVTEKFSGIVKDMIDISKESVTNTVKAFSELPGKLLTVLNDVFTKVKQFRNDMLSTFFRIAADAVKEFLRAMKDFPNSVWNILKQLISRIISSGREFYWAAFNLARRIWEGFKAGLGIRSPSYIEKAMDNILKQTRNSVADLKNVLNSLDDISGPKIFANNIVQASDISAMNASDIGNAVAKAITSIINNSGHKDGKDVILTINGRELARALVPFTAAENMRIATK